MKEEKKMILFANEPCFLKVHESKTSDSSFFRPQVMRSIFPHQANIERFKNLELGRNKVQGEKQVDENILGLLRDLHTEMNEIRERDCKLDSTKEEKIKQFKMDYLQEEIERDFQKLATLIVKYGSLKKEFSKEKEEIKKMIKITEIKKALKMQNNLLKDENEKLEEEEIELDIKLRKRSK